MKIDTDKLTEIMPQCRYPNDWIRPLNDAMWKFHIRNNVQRMAAFLAQIAHESSQLNRIEENLNYSPQRLVAVWPRRFPDVKSALPYARNPSRLATKVYGGRMGNCKEEDGDDGWRYRGRGLIQLTGKNNYTLAEESLNLPFVELPDMLLQPQYAALTAAWYWDSRKLNTLAASLDFEPDDFKVITKKINGGLNGLEERLKFWDMAKQVLDE